MNTQFDDLSAILRRLDVPIGASEAHGLLSGLLAAKPSALAKGAWLTELLDAANLSPGSIGERATEVKALDAWFTQVVESLHDANLNYNPLIPGDDTTVAIRLRALADYCAGFCYGVGLGTANRGNKPLPKDTTELINDFNEIDSAATSDTETIDEFALAEVYEYVRVGVLLIHEELQPIIKAESGVH